MKKSILGSLLLVLLTGPASFAQQIQPTPAMAATVDPASQRAKTYQLSDSVRREIHHLFKVGRRVNTIGFAAGALVTYSSIRDITNKRADWLTGVGLTIGATAMASGITVVTRFSRRREKEVLETIGKGEPLPLDLMVWQQSMKSFPFSKKRG